jgi:hypothetical protein
MARWRACILGSPNAFGDIQPSNVLNLGDPFGYLIDAFHNDGIDCFGLASSDQFFNSLAEEVKPYYFQGSLSQLIPRNSILLYVSRWRPDRLQTGQNRSLEIYAGYPRTFCSLLSRTTISFARPAGQPHEYWARLFAQHGYIAI